MFGKPRLVICLANKKVSAFSNVVLLKLIYMLIAHMWSCYKPNRLS